ncbi:MAG: hypothetical protein IPL23_23335 [Saprospiraceae bacterium]|nr:hypothetical protein [Saprospiraceae bacterium]
MDNEKAKMLSGQPYKAFGDVLLSERQYAKELIFDFNNLRPTEREKRNEIIKNLFGKTGNTFLLSRPLDVIMDTILRLEIIFIPITIYNFGLC